MSAPIYTCEQIFSLKKRNKSEIEMRMSNTNCEIYEFHLSLDVRGSVHYSTIHKKTQQDATVYQNFIIPYLHEAQQVSGDTPPINRSLKLHW
jgi:hypothetical protein